MFVFILARQWLQRSKFSPDKDEYPLIKNGATILRTILFGIALYFAIDIIILLVKLNSGKALTPLLDLDIGDTGAWAPILISFTGAAFYNINLSVACNPD
jgi:hypothetical protein